MQSNAVMVRVDGWTKRPAVTQTRWSYHRPVLRVTPIV